MLIITCPCALALAVPVVQVLASGRLMRQGILLKSATALERFAQVDMVVFDKTGTLTEGRPSYAGGRRRAEIVAAALSPAPSRHPLARALAARGAAACRRAAGVEEIPGSGLRLAHADGRMAPGPARLGCRRRRGRRTPAPELWLARPGAPRRSASLSPTRLRADAAAVVAELAPTGYAVALLSGDRAPTVAAVAGRLGIAEWRARQRPADKAARLEALARRGPRC